MIDVSTKYKPLFDLPKAWKKVKHRNFHKLSAEKQKYWRDLAKVEVVVKTGGRGSGKSLIGCVSISENATTYGHRTLYTRYTDTSLDDSVKPDFEKAIGMLNYNRFAQIKQGRIEFPQSKGKVVFRGLKTSSKNQTAVGKSLSEFSCFVVEEAEEHPSFDEWEKVALSMRFPSVQNYSVLVLNPATKEHWIYQKFFLERGIDAGFNGIKDEILYIHTTYLDVKKKYHTSANWNKFERGRKAYEEYESLTKEQQAVAPHLLRGQWYWYNHVVLGGWLDKAQGVVFKNWKTGEFPIESPFVYGLDFGYSPDPTAMVKAAINVDTKQLFLQEICYLNELSTDQIKKFVQKNCDEDDLIVADNAEKRLINDMREENINVVPCKKGADSIRKGIKDMLGFEIIVCGESVNLRRELDNYCWNDKRAGVPMDAYNHLIDGARYAMERLKTGFYVG